MSPVGLSRATACPLCAAPLPAVGRDSFATPLPTLDAARFVLSQATVGADWLMVTFADGRVLRVPLRAFPRLFRARPQSRRSPRILHGTHLFWPALDLDLHVADLLGLPEALVEAAFAGHGLNP